jgi:hypothetical protein
MFEIQNEFLVGFLGQYLTEMSVPLARIRNKKPQNNDVPDRLDITPAKKG